MAALVLLAGCGATAANGSARHDGGQATATAMATATPQVPQLSWRHITLPAQVAPLRISGFVVSPADSRDAWLCLQASASSADVWATRDAGATWMDRGALPQVTSEQGWGCALVGDEGDSRSLAAIITWGSGEAGTLRSASLISHNAGAQWSRLPGELAVSAFGTQGQTTFAILDDTAAAPSSTQTPFDMVASTDGLRTWRSVRPASLATDDALFTLWLRPSSAEIVAASLQHTWWHSMDAGAHWTRLTNAPGMQIALGAWLPDRAQWLFCGWPQAATQVICSTDMGTTWTARTGIADCYPDAVLPNGTLLAGCPPNGGEDGSTPPTLYALPMSGSTWGNLGTAPALLLYPLAATNWLWCGKLQAGTLAVASLPA